VVEHERGDGVVDGLGGQRQRADIGHGARWPGGGVPGQHAEGQVHNDGLGALGGQGPAGRPGAGSGVEHSVVASGCGRRAMSSAAIGP